jgi:prefoldin alpha subunit
VNVNDDELRQAYAVMESYKERVESLSRQVQMLRVSLDEVTLASNSLKAFHEAKEGDEIMVPVGAQCLVTVKVTSKKNVIVGIGSNLSVEKTTDEAIQYMDGNIAEISEALKSSANALGEAQQALTTLSQAVQQEYAARQQTGIQ